MVSFSSILPFVFVNGVIHLLNINNETSSAVDLTDGCGATLKQRWLILPRPRPKSMNDDVTGMKTTANGWQTSTGRSGNDITIWWCNFNLDNQDV